MIGGMAADDHVAIHYIEEKLEKIVKANAQGAAYHLQVVQGQLVEQKMEGIDLRRR